jgi:hypothetical protein
MMAGEGGAATAEVVMAAMVAVAAIARRV